MILQLCQKLPMYDEKTQEILGVKHKDMDCGGWVAPLRNYDGCMEALDSTWLHPIYKLEISGGALQYKFQCTLFSISREWGALPISQDVELSPSHRDRESSLSFSVVPSSLYYCHHNVIIYYRHLSRLW
jgi:hypothetical protein